VLSAEELRARADSFGWFHPIDLGQGVTTRGLSQGPFVSAEQMPDLQGRSVLDIGAWDGYYSFQAERLGAARIMALDHYVWGVDMGARQVYWAECRAKGVLPDHDRDLTDFWMPDLPGRRAFDFAREALDSRVEATVGDFATMDLAAVGTYDVVLYLGVLYHMKEPLRALERLRSVTDQVAVIETQAMDVRGLETVSLLQFFAGGDFAADYGNWYIPTIEALHQMTRAAGFSRVETVVGPPEGTKAGPSRLRRALGRVPPLVSTNHPQTTYYRAVVHAFR
jgi:tRNA (mo5U34)-methyltransferase